MNVFGGIACLHTFRSSCHVTTAWMRNYYSGFQVCLFQHLQNARALGLNVNSVFLEDQRLSSGIQILNKPKIFMSEREWERGKMGNIPVLCAPKWETWITSFLVHDLQWTHWLLRSLNASPSPSYSMGNDWLTSEINENTSIANNFSYHEVEKKKEICVTVLRR